jgi:probable rRNA maturation factor
VNIFFSDEQDEPIDGAALRDLAGLVLGAEALPEGTEMALLLIGPDQMASYNEQFMDRRGPTDVLAFPLEILTPGEPPVRVANGPPLALGDVFLCPAEIRVRAVEQGWAFEDYLALLVVHGTLHLLGYDHQDDAAADTMEHRERELLEAAGRNLL